MSNPKQILIWRNDLRSSTGHKVRTGKIAAQLAHASMAAILNLGNVVREYSDLDGQLTNIKLTIPLYEQNFIFNGKPDIDHQVLIEWIEDLFTKVCVYVNSEQELLDIIQKAKNAGLINSLITDAGLTEFNNVPTITCGCVGPAYPEQLQDITGHLHLL